ncbi:MAG: DUF697 domain-containing protein [Desulfobacteraceae bacterium]|nr:DUF697 domain-containing protein [Desulfobacteraceae bacterium]
MTSETQTAELTEAERKEKIQSLIRNHMLAAMGIGLIPMPVVDFVALTGVQLDLLNKMSKAYGVTFSEERGKMIISSLVSSVLPLPLTGYAISFLKAIPLIGQTIGALTMPMFAGGLTYALGKVFVQHFESGGTFLNFDPDSVKIYFAEQYREGKLNAEKLKKEEKQEA